MLNLIDKNLLMAYLDAIKPENPVSQFGEDANFVIEKIKEYANAMPTIEPEVRHGRWIQQESPNGGSFNCSECGHEFTVPCSEMIDPRDYVCYLDDYCGKCGAKMDALETCCCISDEEAKKILGGVDNG